MKIEELGLSVRPYNVLKRAGIYTVEQLQQLSDEDLMAFRNMGRHSLAEIREKVEYVKTMTNADKIRAMNDDELGEFIISVNEDGWPFACQNKPECQYGAAPGACNNCFLDWLKQTAKEDFP